MAPLSSVVWTIASAAVIVRDNTIENAELGEAIIKKVHLNARRELSRNDADSLDFLPPAAAQGGPPAKANITNPVKDAFTWFTNTTCDENKREMDKLWTWNPKPFCGNFSKPATGCILGGSIGSDGSATYSGWYYIPRESQEFVKHDHNGFYLSAFGVLYTGDFKCGKRTGTGTWYFQDGTAIQSKVKDGERYGPGLRWTADRKRVYKMYNGRDVIFRGRWVELTADELAAALKKLGRKKPEQLLAPQGNDRTPG